MFHRFAGGPIVRFIAIYFIGYLSRFITLLSAVNLLCVGDMTGVRDALRKVLQLFLLLKSVINRNYIM